MPNLKSPHQVELVIMLTESEVIAAICRFLKSQQFHISQSLSETEKGIDIEGVAPDGESKFSIEAKGETSSKSRTARFGKPFDSKQVFDHVSKAFYCAARDNSEGLMAGIAFPHNAAHVKCVEKILPALRKLGIEVFWALPDGNVEVELIWLNWNSIPSRSA
jgi:hypothetical protein